VILVICLPVICCSSVEQSSHDLFFANFFFDVIISLVTGAMAIDPCTNAVDVFLVAFLYEDNEIF